MKRNKLSLLGLLALISLNGCSLFGSSYNVTVLLPDGSKAKNMNVSFYDGNTATTVITNNDGVATFKGENKDYNLYIYDQGYALKAGTIVNKDNDKPTVTLNKVNKSTVGKGIAYEPYLVNEGVFDVTIDNQGSNDITYYGFRPTRPGTYIIESWANPAIDVEVGFYGNNDQYVLETPTISDDNSGVNNNFKMTLNISIEEFNNTGTLDSNGNMIYEKDENGNYIPGGSYKLGIKNKSKEAVKFPVEIKWISDYVLERVVADVMTVSETLTQYSDNTSSELFYKDASLSGLTNVVYNEEDGFYHVDSKDGYVLVAKISEPSKYIDKAFSKTNPETNENEGILATSAIIVDNGRKDYSKFLEEYEKYCNNDGVYPVTEELKVFLQYYYINVKDWIESVSQDVVNDEYGWMFACGYYARIEDLYAKPWSGEGISDDPYLLLTDEYYAKIGENQKVYYSYSLKNTINEVIIYVKTDCVNAVITVEDKEYSSDTGAYFEIRLGGGLATRNPDQFDFTLSTKDGASENFVFKVGVKEITVDGDKIAEGSNTVLVEENGVVECSYTATSKSIVTIKCNETNALIVDSNSNVYYGNKGEIKFTTRLEANETLTFSIYTENYQEDYITFDLVIENEATLGLNMVRVTQEKLFDGVTCIFTAEENGTYKIYADDENAAIGMGGSNQFTWKYGGTTDNGWTVNLKAGESVSFYVASSNYTPMTVRFFITKL